MQLVTYESSSSESELQKTGWRSAQTAKCLRVEVWHPNRLNRFGSKGTHSLRKNQTFNGPESKV